MLVNTNDNLWLPFLEGKPHFSSKFSIYIFENVCLIQKWIKELLSKEENNKHSEKVTKETFLQVRESFGQEPLQFSHLRIGNNIFCFYEAGTMRLVNLYFDGHSGIKEKQITKKMYAGRKKMRKITETYFWLFSEVDTNEQLLLKSSLVKMPEEV